MVEGGKGFAVHSYFDPVRQVFERDTRGSRTTVR
jgi:hypothetical protein